MRPGAVGGQFEDGEVAAEHAPPVGQVLRGAGVVRRRALLPCVLGVAPGQCGQTGLGAVARRPVEGGEVPAQDGRRGRVDHDVVEGQDQHVFVDRGTHEAG